MTEYPCIIAFDFKLMRPGCAIVQVTLGGTIGNDQLMRFDDWLLHPTDDMTLATIRSQAEMDKAIQLAQEVAA